MASAQETFNPYTVLGVPTTAGEDDIRRAFRARARTLHPDINHAPDAGERFGALRQAYGLLSDSTARARYDRGGDVAGFGASAARDVARRVIQRHVRDHLRNLRVRKGE